MAETPGIPEVGDWYELPEYDYNRSDQTLLDCKSDLQHPGRTSFY